MNDNNHMKDIFSSNEEGNEPKKSTGFDFPKPPVSRENGENCTYHYVGDPNKTEETTEPAKHIDEYFNTVEKDETPKAETEKVEAEKVEFNPYEAKPDFGSQQSYTPPQQNYYEPPKYNPQPSFTDNPKPKKNGMGIKVVVGVIVLCIVVGIGLIAAGFLGFVSDDKIETSSGSQNEVVDQVPTVHTPEISTTQKGDIDEVNSVWVAEKVRQSVVGVMTYMNGQLSGEGSGVLWMEKDGYTYILTCAHVIDEKGADLGVLLLNGKRYEATLVGADTRTDIGVVKIEATGLPLADMGDSSSLKIGEPVYAVGNPGGSEYFGSMTDGIISSIDRSVTSTYKMTCIQHNAAINPGNSGGALVNTAGQIVGINSSKIASTEYEGMGFAVPTSIAKPVAEALVNYGYVPNRPKLGIEYASVSSYQLYSMIVSIKGLPQGSLVIAGISSDSSLAGTKAQVGDLIIGVNGKDMEDSSVLLDLIETGAVGDSLTLTLCRVESRTYKTTEFDVTITLVEDKPGEEKEEETTKAQGGYYYGGAQDFEDFFNQYFGW